MESVPVSGHSLGFGHAQLRFRLQAWTHRKAIADGHAIMDYLEQTVAERDLAENIHFGCRVLGAEFSSTEGLWTVTAQRSGTGGETTEFTARFLFAGGTGYYDYESGFTPEFAGVEDFGGGHWFIRSTGPRIWTTRANGWS